MAEVKLEGKEVWRVITAGLFILGYIDQDRVPAGTYTALITNSEARITIKDSSKIPPVPYKEKIGEELGENYKPGQWKEEDTKYVS